MSETPVLPQPSSEIVQAAQIYRAFMEEIKMRLAAIHGTIAGLRLQPNMPFAFIEAESAILQLRNVCELMAHCAIVANKPFGKVEPLLDSWDARLAYNDLKTINADCFPRPVRSVEETEPGHKHLNIDPEGLPTMRGLLRLYLRCGRLLHRGIVRHAYDGTQKMYDLDWIDEWATRIGELLLDHTAMVLDHGLILISHFYAGENGTTRVLIAQADGPARLVEPDKASQPSHPKDGQSVRK